MTNVILRKMKSAITRTRRVIVSQRFGFNPATIYRDSFYSDGGFHKTEHSAAVISSWAVERLAPRSLLDLGSGGGHYLRAFEALGVDALGLEGSEAGIHASGDRVLALAFDLRRPVRLSRPFDLVMCVEVAEHIPHRFSRRLVESICSNTARYVLFTAAPPGTPGSDHINCQPAEYWIALFSEHGVSIRADLTESLREVARLQDTAEWWKSWSWCFERQRAPTEG
jgi:hypothetical protein